MVNSTIRLFLVSCCASLFVLPNAADAGSIGEMTLDELPARHAAVVQLQAAPSELSARFAEVLPAVQRFVSDEGLVPGLVFSRTLWADGDWMVVEAGLEVAQPGSDSEETAVGVIRFVELPAGPSAAVDHYGPYDEVGAAHATLARWWGDQGMQLVAPALEYYVTDPGSEPDPQKWLTRVQHPVASAETITERLGLSIGRWVGPAGAVRTATGEPAATFYEEQWSPFVDGESVGTFRMRGGGRPQFYEFMTIDASGVEQAGLRRPELTIKHFSPRLVGWEQPDEAVRFALIELRQGLVRWGRREGNRWAELVYQRNADALTVRLFKTGGDEPPSVSGFAFDLARP